uniref:GST N-terminal domain-containing protein n=1 Tax=Syphacia muris TaxID=451379 RepID=A0A0N5AJ11_9BILA
MSRSISIVYLFIVAKRTVNLSKLNNLHAKHIPVYVYEKRVPAPFFESEAYKTPFDLPNPAPAVNRALGPGLIRPVAAAVGFAARPLMRAGII